MSELKIIEDTMHNGADTHYNLHVVVILEKSESGKSEDKEKVFTVEIPLGKLKGETDFMTTVIDYCLFTIKTRTSINASNLRVLSWQVVP